MNESQHSQWQPPTPPMPGIPQQVQPTPEPALATEPAPAQRPWLLRNLAVVIPWALVIALAVTLLVVLLPSSEPEAAKPATHDITVNFELSDSDTARNGCEGDGGYSDIGAGTPVTIKDGSGNLLGTASLGSGHASGSSCLWTVTVSDVRDGADFYSCEVGRRGAISQSAAELKSAGYEFDLSLG